MRARTKLGAVLTALSILAPLGFVLYARRPAQLGPEAAIERLNLLLGGAKEREGDDTPGAALAGAVQLANEAFFRSRDGTGTDHFEELSRWAYWDEERPEEKARPTVEAARAARDAIIQSGWPELTRRAATAQTSLYRFSFNPNGTLDDSELTRLGGARRLARYCGALARFAAQDGRSEEATEWIEAMIGLAKPMLGHGPVIDFLVGLAILDAAIFSTLDIVTVSELSDGQWQRLSTGINAVDLEAALIGAYEADAILMHHTAREIMSQPLSAAFTEQAQVFSAFTRSAFAGKRIGEPPEPPGFDSWLDRLSGLGAIDIMYSAAERTVHAAALAEMRRSLVTVAAHNQQRPSDQNLPAPSLAELGLEPADWYTDDPLLYRPLDKPDDGGWTFVLYSAGPDGVHDSDGQPEPIWGEWLGGVWTGGDLLIGPASRK